MAMRSKRPVTEQQVKVLEYALVEWRELGRTDKKCPRCGGELRFEDFGSAYLIECEKCDLRVTGRGI